MPDIESILKFYLDPVRIVVKEQYSWARHLLGLHHGLKVRQETHVLGHVRR